MTINLVPKDGWWFAWRPVMLSSEHEGEIVWLERVWRLREEGREFSFAQGRWITKKNGKRYFKGKWGYIAAEEHHFYERLNYL
jgi:hypothetical protein